MAETTIITCDVCGKRKGETNHWITVATLPGIPGIGFGPSDSEYAADIHVEHICGEACAHTRLSQFFTQLQQQTRGAAA